MASSPSFDKSTGWWSIRYFAGPAAGRVKQLLVRHPGWKKGQRPPRKPPAEVELLARKYQDLEVQARHGVDVAPARAADLAGYVAAYLASYALTHKPASLKNAEWATERFLAYCSGRGVLSVQAATAAVFRDFGESLLAVGLSRGSLASIRCALSPIWTRAMQDGLVAVNPAKSMLPPGKSMPPPPNYLTKDEILRLVAALRHDWVKDFVLLGVNCGARVMSLLQLPWERVHFDRGVIALDSKTGYYEVPMSRVARVVLERRRFAADPSPLVFSRPDGRPWQQHSTYGRLLRAAKRAGITRDLGRWNHLLRHSFASHAILDGVPLATVSKWLGHASIAMTMRYSHLAQADSARRMEGFGLGDVAQPGG